MRLQWKCGRVVLLFTIVVSLLVVVAFLLPWERPYNTLLECELHYDGIRWSCEPQKGAWLRVCQEFNPPPPQGFWDKTVAHICGIHHAPLTLAIDRATQRSYQLPPQECVQSFAKATPRQVNSPAKKQQLLDVISESSQSKQDKAASPILLFNYTSLFFTNITKNIVLTEKKFLAIGLCSVKRKHEPYLIDTLRSIFEQSSSTELQQMVVVVHLCDFNMAWCEMTARLITKMFPSHVLAKRLLLIHAPEEIYPSLEGLKANYNDPPDRVRFRSKQNADYSFLLSFCASLADYYLMLEDDLKCAKNFFTTIQKAIASRQNTYWVILEFSRLGYIGKLYHSHDLPTLAQFLLLFYQEMPCDWLLTHFRVILTQNNPINFKPALFQHMGLYSSFKGGRNELKDGDFQESTANVADNPAATFHTNIKVFEDYRPEKAYSTESGYFWGKTPVAGDYFTLKFVKPQKVDAIEVLTSSVDRKNDGLKAGYLEVGSHTKEQSCSSFKMLGHFVHGEFRAQTLSETIPFKIDCIRINVIRNQTEWLIIRSISIFLVPK